MLHGRKRLVTGLLGLVAIVSVSLVPTTPTYAEPDIDDVQARVDTLYHQAEVAQERYNDAKLALLLQFESKFPTTGPKTLATVYLMTMDIYSEKDNKPKIAEYGDKAIGKDPDNVTALLRVSRIYAAEKTNLPKAVEYAEKAKSIIGNMRSMPAPTGQSDEQWKQWLDANATAADQYSSYAKMLQGISK